VRLRKDDRELRSALAAAAAGQVREQDATAGPAATSSL
jgi:hypothetical protein